MVNETFEIPKMI